ncbi:MAG: aminoglycoside phosphotransferase family protein, partial [Gammaproteobacteria bacterium]
VRDHVDARRSGWIPALIPTAAGAWAHVDEDGEWWRLWRFVEGARSIGASADADVALAAGEAFGEFQELIADLTDPPLVPTIPGFLELDRYLAALDAALADHGADDAVDLVPFVDAHRWLEHRFPRGERPIHGDCKLNNLLFDAASTVVVAVLDLDTVMPGHWAWDFGDLARSLMMGGGDEAEIFAVVARSFVAAAGIEATVEELVQAPIHVAFMLGVRFLTDHLKGDGYFRVGFRGQNLDRAREQFHLVSRLEGRLDALEASAERALGARRRNITKAFKTKGER